MSLEIKSFPHLNSSINMQKGFIQFILLGIFVLVIIAAGVFYWGSRSSTKLNKLQSQTISSGKDKNTSYPFTLRFNKNTIVLEIIGSGEIKDTFWTFPIKEISYPVGLFDPTKELYEQETLEETWGDKLYFVKQVDTFYELQSGGHRSLTLVGDEYLTNALKGKEVIDQPSSTRITKICQADNYPLGSITATAVKCTTTFTDANNARNILDESSTINCYLPVNNEKFLAYEQNVKPVSTNVNMCEVLRKMGLNNIFDQSSKWESYNGENVTFKFPPGWIQKAGLKNGSEFSQEFNDPEGKLTFVFMSKRNYNQQTGSPYATIDEYIGLPYKVKSVLIDGQEGRQALPRAGSENVYAVDFFSKDSKLIYRLSLEVGSNPVDVPEKEVAAAEDIFNQIIFTFKFLN